MKESGECSGGDAPPQLQWKHCIGNEYDEEDVPHQVVVGAEAQTFC